MLMSNSLNILLAIAGMDEKGKADAERIAKRMARAGVCSRRDAEKLIAEGRVKLNGQMLTTPATLVTDADKIEVDGALIGQAEATRLFLFHKPAGCVTTNRDEKGRQTVFDVLQKDLPRLITIGRLDMNTEGLLLLTNDGAYARELELPSSGWVRTYRARAYGEITQQKLDTLKKGITYEGVRYGPIDARLENASGRNGWIILSLKEGKNREVRNVLRALDLQVNRLIRTSYGAYTLENLAVGDVREVAPDRVKS